MVKNYNFHRGQDQSQGHGQGHIERKIFRSVQISHNNYWLLLKKLNLISFDSRSHSQCHGQGDHSFRAPYYICLLFSCYNTYKDTSQSSV